MIAKAALSLNNFRIFANNCSVFYTFVVQFVNSDGEIEQRIGSPSVIEKSKSVKLRGVYLLRALSMLWCPFARTYTE